MDPKLHWSTVYATKNHQKVSWYTDHIVESLDYIDALHLPKAASIIDVGGEDSFLVNDLLARGFNKISVLDLSKQALNISWERVGKSGVLVSWIADDVVKYPFQKNDNDLWHHRAVFHFLTST